MLSCYFRYVEIIYIIIDYESISSRHLLFCTHKSYQFNLVVDAYYLWIIGQLPIALLQWLHAQSTCHMMWLQASRKMMTLNGVDSSHHLMWSGHVCCQSVKVVLCSWWCVPKDLWQHHTSNMNTKWCGKQLIGQQWLVSYVIWVYFLKLLKGSFLTLKLTVDTVLVAPLFSNKYLTYRKISVPHALDFWKYKKYRFTRFLVY